MMNIAPTAQPLNERILSIPPTPQEQSPLFSRIPPELRHEIFSLALADFPDPSVENRYEANTCYTRPSYFAPRKSDIRLLRTCRAVYSEAWFLPFVMREQSDWLTARDRCPPTHWWEDNYSGRLGRTLDQIRHQLGEDIVEIESLRAFAQMYKLEGGDLARLLRTPHLHPRSLTLTIRHADWWYWENDFPLRFDGGWIKDVCDVLSPSVREIHIELESLERKKDQVDSIVRQMSERWFFKRKDGVGLYPDVTFSANKVDRWTGSSTWHGKTWRRDESRPGQIDYYIVDVVFRPMHLVQRLGGQVSNSAVEDAEKGRFDEGKLALRCFREGSDGNEGGHDSDEDMYGDEEWDDAEDEEDDDEGQEEDDDGDEEMTQAEEVNPAESEHFGLLIYDLMHQQGGTPDLSLTLPE